MGTGKTTAMIRYINESPEDWRFIICTPYLEQVDRILRNCPGKRFVAPDSQFTSKRENIKGLLTDKANIATTHALFMLLDEEARELIIAGNYILVIDEAMETFDALNISRYDQEIICEKFCSEDNDGRLRWEVADYTGKLDGYKREIESGAIYRCSPTTLIRSADIETFAAFREVFLMTYLFDGQFHKSFFDMHGWHYRYWYVEGNSPATFRLTQEPVVYPTRDFSSLITVKHSFKGEKLITDRGSFSLSWYETNAADHKKPSEQFNILRKHMASFFRTASKAGYDNPMWTTFKPYRKALAASGYSNGFLHCAAKATNDYRERTALAYPINRYVNPNLVNYIYAHGGRINHNDFALSEMVQWVWRSAIRDGKPITLYIPSDRMCLLFTDWLDEISGKKPVAEEPPAMRRKRALSTGDLPLAHPMA